MHKRNKKNSLDVKLAVVGTGMLIASLGFLGKGFYQEFNHESANYSSIQEQSYQREQKINLGITATLLVGSFGILGSVGARYFMRLQKEYAHKKHCEHKHEHGEEECHNPMHTGLH